MLQENNIPVLCTRPLPDSLLLEAVAAGISVECMPFIETEAIAGVEVQQEIENALLQSATVVFTSMNAVDAVAAELEGQMPDWQVYCIGAATRRLVIEHFGVQCLAGTAPDASQLAELIIREGLTEEVIFFCGDQRRDELPALLRNVGIEVEEITVYQTVELLHTLKKTYAAVLFFSPSAVRSFFRCNQLPPSTVAFAIGATTAAEIRKYSQVRIEISSEPSKEELIGQMIAWFTGA